MLSIVQDKILILNIKQFNTNPTVEMYINESNKIPGVLLIWLFKISVP